MAQNCCCCCSHPHQEHGQYVTSLDGIEYDNEKRLKKLLEQNYGICEVKVDLFEGTLTVGYDPDKITEEGVKEALSRPDFLLKKTLRTWMGAFLEKHTAWIQFVSSTALLALSWTLLFILRERYEFPNHANLIINGLAVLITGWPTLREALAGAKEGKLNVKQLITLAVIGALALGHWLEAATVLVITLWGEALESATLRRCNKEVFSLSVLGARSALVRHEGALVEIPVHKVREGQVVVVNHGMKIPVDGVLIGGSAQVDEAPITGEASFREKKEGDKVYAGSIVVAGALEMTASAGSGESVLARVAKLVEEARKRKTPSEKAADRFAAYFIPIILAAAVGVFLASWLAFNFGEIDAARRAITVLIVACPCALVLATPTAVSAAIGVAAKRGILFRNGAVLERLPHVDTLLVDKTGTLTYARPCVVAVRAFGGATEEDVLKAAALVERRSAHPLGKAIVDYTKSRSTSLTEEPDRFMEFEGGGACAILGDRRVKIGALWLMEDGRRIPDDVKTWLARGEATARTCVLVADGDRIIGGLELEDEVREDAARVLQTLRGRGIKQVIMATGDHEQSAARVAEGLGLDAYWANCMPDTKIAKVAQLHEEGRVVAMVGDGVNDAPALAAADVGVSMGAMGSEAAIEAGDVALMRNDLTSLREAFAIARRALGTIKANIFFAVSFNLAMVVLVTLGHVDMLLGAILHQVSAVAVIANSMALFLRRPAGVDDIPQQK